MAVPVHAPPAPETPAPEQQHAPPPAGQSEQAGGLAAALAAYSHVRKVGYRYRDALAPHAAVFGTLAAGAALHACRVPAWQVLAAEAAAAGVGALFPAARARLRRQLWLLAAGGWLPLAAEIGAGGVMQTMLVGAGGMLAVPRIWRYRIRITRPIPKPRRPLPSAAAKPAIEGPDPNVQVWRAKTARKARGALPGSDLTGQTPFPYGVRYRITLDGQTTEDAIGARKQICADYGKRYEELHVEETDDGQLNAAELTILSRLAVEDVQRWETPLLDMETGILPLGPFADGRGDAAIQVWEPGSGPLPVGIFGAMRVGKSSLIKLAAVEFKRAGNIKLMYLDPQRGQSAPALMPYLPAPALGIEEIRRQLEWLRAEMYARNAMLRGVEWTDSRGRRQVGKQSFDAPGMNGLDMLVAVIDESHRVLVWDDLADIVFELMAEGSKCGIMVWLLNQSALVDNLGGGSILNLLNSGNLVLLRTGDTYTAQATFGQRMEAYPNLIRKTFPGGQHSKGCGYVWGATTRPVMMRVRDVEDMHDAMGGEPMGRIRWMTQPSDQAAAGEPAGAPAGPSPERTAEPAAEADPELDLDNVVDFSPIEPDQQAEAERRILRLLDGHELGLDGSDLSLGAELHPVVVFRIVSDLIARGEVTRSDDRYVRRAAS